MLFRSGEDYSIEQIRIRILSQTRAEKKLPEPPRQVIRVRLLGSLKTAREITGFRALYFHYIYAVAAELVVLAFAELIFIKVRRSFE